jgi:hypothetical protein
MHFVPSGFCSIQRFTSKKRKNLACKLIRQIFRLEGMVRASGMNLEAGPSAEVQAESLHIGIREFQSPTSGWKKNAYRFG